MKGYCFGFEGPPGTGKTSIINKLEESILINIRKIDIFTSKLKKVFVKWEHDSYDPFFNINDLNDLKLAENMIKKNMIK